MDEDRRESKYDPDDEFAPADPMIFDDGERPRADLSVFAAGSPPEVPTTEMLDRYREQYGSGYTVSGVTRENDPEGVWVDPPDDAGN